MFWCWNAGLEPVIVLLYMAKETRTRDDVFLGNETHKGNHKRTRKDAFEDAGECLIREQRNAANSEQSVLISDSSAL